MIPSAAAIDSKPGNLKVACAGCNFAILQLPTSGELLEAHDLCSGTEIAIQGLPRETDGDRPLLCACCLEQAQAIVADGHVFQLQVFRKATREQLEAHLDEVDPEELAELAEFVKKIGRGERVPKVEVAPLTDEEWEEREEAIRALDDRRPFYERALESRRRSAEWNETRRRRLKFTSIPGGSKAGGPSEPDF